MARQRKRNTSSAKGGQHRRKERELVGTLIEWPREDRDKVKAAAALAGYKSLQEFCRETVLARMAEVLKSMGFAKLEENGK
jgi:hypothetical protein